MISEIIDVRDYRLLATDNTEKSLLASKLAQKASRADGFIIVSPEYNHGYPGVLKMLLDMLYSQYAHKPVGICGVFSGAWGGTRMVPTAQAVHFPKIQELFDDSGNLKGKSQHDQAKKLLDELTWYAKALKEQGQVAAKS